MITALRLRLADVHWLYKPRKFLQACDVVKRYADHFVQKALQGTPEEEESEEASDAREFIVELYKELKDSGLVRDQLVNVLLAGRDTTACTMSWVL